MPPASQKSKAKPLKLKAGPITARGARRAGLHSQHLTRLVAAGTLERTSRGQYRRTDAPITEHHSLVRVAAAAPRGVICLLSALSFHGLGTQLPADVWVAVEQGRRAPAITFPPVRVVRFSGQAFTHGIETHVLENQPVRVYSVAKTLADIFKFRNRIGLDVAIEALKDAWHERRFTMDDLDRAAHACRVSKAIAPYLQAIAAS